MKVRQRTIFSLALMSALLVGCKTTQQARQSIQPTARMVGFKLQDAKLDYVTAIFEVEVDNPYPESLPLVSLSYNITSDVNMFLSATAITLTTVPANSKEVFALQDKIAYERLLRALKGEPGSIIPYQADLRLWVDAPDAGLVKLPLKIAGQLLLPEAPDVAVGEKVYHALDVIFVPTPQDVVEKMLELAEVKKDDLVYDLGCGDGRIVVTVAKKYGCKAVGYDLDPQRVKESLENVAKNQAGDLVRIEQRDIFTLDLSQANIVTLYLLPSLNVKLIPQLEKLKPGSRIVSHDFAMEGVKPDKVVTLTSEHDNTEHTIYLWTAPLKKEPRAPGVK
jgi:SAM-dependent methyltransferase/LEA14-like dessication related protein